MLTAVAMVLHTKMAEAFIFGTCARVAALLSSHTCAKPKPYAETLNPVASILPPQACQRVPALWADSSPSRPPARSLSPLPPPPSLSFLSVQVALPCLIAAHMAGALPDMAAVELLDGWYWSRGSVS